MKYTYTELYMYNVTCTMSRHTLCTHVVFVYADDFASRFQFNNSIPPPEIWKPGPKTYPSTQAQTKQKAGGECEVQLVAV